MFLGKQQKVFLRLPQGY